MLEDNLRMLFTLEAEADQPPSHISVPAADRGARAKRHRRALTIGSPVLAAAAVIAVIAASVALAGGGHSKPAPAKPAMPVTAPGPAGWARLPEARIAPRSEYSAVWTGKEMIVWGGYSGMTQYADGAAYDPATNTWRELAPIPGSLGGNLTGSGSYAVWTGKVMVAWGFFGKGQGAHGGGSLAAATYNPATNSWKTGTVAPVQAPLFGDAVWTGKQMIVWGPSVGQSGRLEGLAYDPATGKWSVLPASPLGTAQRDSMLTVWTGRYLVVGGGDSAAGLQKDAAAYDPATGTWMRLPDAPVPFEGNAAAGEIWTGASVLTVEDGVPGGRPLSLNPATRSWSLGPTAPGPGRQEAYEVWTGSEVLVWGGGVQVGNTCCTAVNPGYSYTP